MDEQISNFLRLRSSWVVVYIVIVHMDLEAAAATGLFGLLCDAPVQIVGLRDEAKMDAFDDFAPDPNSLERATAMLEYIVSRLHKEGPKSELAMYPVIMFRLCTEKCYEAAEEMSGEVEA
ncbi:hypothetical protein F4677DRAFT_435854, partial [Hypoxylon crocopeplum]